MLYQPHFDGTSTCAKCLSSKQRNASKNRQNQQKSNEKQLKDGPAKYGSHQSKSLINATILAEGHWHGDFAVFRSVVIIPLVELRRNYEIEFSGESKPNYFCVCF